MDKLVENRAIDDIADNAIRWETPILKSIARHYREHEQLSKYDSHVKAVDNYSVFLRAYYDMLTQYANAGEPE